jgi:hypothetical protein
MRQKGMVKMAKIPTFPPPYQVCGRLYRLQPMAENALFLSQIVRKNIGIRWNIVQYINKQSHNQTKLRKSL